METRTVSIDELWASVAGPSQDIILRANTASQDIMRYRDRTSWYAVGTGLLEIRGEALRLSRTNNLQSHRYRQFQRLLLSKVPALAMMYKQDSAGCAYAIWMVENREAVEAWLSTLSVAKRNRLNHPSTVRRNFDAAHRSPREPLDWRLRYDQVDPEGPDPIEELREGITALRDRSQGLMDRATYDRLVMCLHHCDLPEAAHEMLEVLRGLERALVREEGIGLQDIGLLD